ncbi:DUF4177 domain-containing protein [Prauserella cavernicola]|uniref:DUF4177 domain-containing protein n=1 Tax=Prauserella cavernicola TaxID=2800127 RepID=A0A934QPI9_9PSEU|nr:DUF4177 domain-containing protein [Prauserella cavernicola]MBK1783736.1 DUF4177 domain-containing protein [Prauserella cavernicola]
MAQFEHKILTYEMKWKGFPYSQMEKELNELGREGWESVGTIVPSIGNGQTHEISIVLKRTVG